LFSGQERFDARRAFSLPWLKIIQEQFS
jgi:hypothetical protein